MEDRRSDTSGKPRPSRILLKPRVLSPDQKRASERTSTLRTVLARVEGQEKSAELPLINISPTGLQLSAGEELDVGTTILVEVLPGQVLSATAKWVREDNGNFLIGAEWDAPITFDEVWKIRSGSNS